MTFRRRTEHPACTFASFCILDVFSPFGALPRPSFPVTGVVEEWCNQVTRYLAEAPAEDARDKFPGPKTILTYWRQRLSRLTSITEQLKLKECKNILLTLCVVAKNDKVDDVLRQGVVALVRKWKAVDVNITEVRPPLPSPYPGQLQPIQIPPLHCRLPTRPKTTSST